ncbi:hypothetical protein [Mesorhizobium sp. B2-3-5]|uniref:hypothetical protein n=1 Tax=Mesorhizobium sp. B2-3-5 TaxID=2589958 RepID=UPI001FEF9273|nr:hypothetical protein [Mesorhizobium sp. B2-3-5]
MLLRRIMASLCLGVAPCSFAPASRGGSTACMVDGGDYRIELPNDGDVRGVFVYFHGFKSSAELQMGQCYAMLFNPLYLLDDNFF